MALAAPFEATRALFGFGWPPQCLGKPHSASAPPGLTPDADEALQAEARQDQLEQDQPRAVVQIEGTEVLQQLTGPGHTEEPWGVWGTDLGHPFEYGERLGLLFGDTFGDAQRGGWRSNVLAWAVRDDADTLRISDMATRGGRAGELLGSLKINGWEQTVIPTNSTVVGDDIVVHYMSVQCWGVAGSWAVDHAGLAVSRDGGRTFERVMPPAWGANTGFAQVAFVRAGDHVYVFGIPEGRHGPARLARTRPETLPDVRSWTYWDGESWVPDPGAAISVVPPPVGELSVQWHEPRGTWVMMYLHDARAAVVLRTADRLEGPWSAPVTVVTEAEIPALYAPYLLPDLAADGAVRYTLSRFDIYNVLHVRTRLTPPSR